MLVLGVFIMRAALPARPHLDFHPEAFFCTREQRCIETHPVADGVFASSDKLK